jgi:hypothetical protein
MVKRPVILRSLKTDRGTGDVHVSSLRIKLDAPSKPWPKEACTVFERNFACYIHGGSHRQAVWCQRSPGLFSAWSRWGVELEACQSPLEHLFEGKFCKALNFFFGRPRSIIHKVQQRFIPCLLGMSAQITKQSHQLLRFHRYDSAALG